MGAQEGAKGEGSKSPASDTGVGRNVPTEITQIQLRTHNEVLTEQGIIKLKSEKARLKTCEEPAKGM